MADTTSNVASGAAAGSAFGPWGAVIGGALGLLGGLWGGSKDKAAAEKAAKMNLAQINASLQQLGWFGQTKFKTTDASTILADQIARTTGTSGQSQIKEWTDMMLHGTSQASKDHARAQLEKHLAKYGGGETLDKYLKYAQAQEAKDPGQLTAFGGLQQNFLQAQSQLKQGGQQLLQGYQNAAKTITQVGRGAQRAIMQQGQQSLAQGQQGLAQAGLLNSSLSAQLARANRADTSQQLTGLASSLAPIRAQAQANIGEAQYKTQAGLAALQQNYGQQQMQLAQQRIQALMGIQYAPGPSFLESVGGAGGLFQTGSAWGETFGNLIAHYTASDKKE